MAGLSNTVREALLNWMLLGTVMPTAPTARYVSLHSGDPGITGANEITGAGYARQGSVTFNAPADSGADELSDNSTLITFTNGGVSTWSVSYVGLWKTLAGTGASDFLIGGAFTTGTVVPGGSYKVALGDLNVLAR